MKLQMNLRVHLPPRPPPPHFLPPLSSSSSSSSLLLARDMPCLDDSALRSFMTASFSSSVDGVSAKAFSNCLRDLAQASRSLRTDRSSLSYASSLHWRVSILRRRPSRVLKRAPVAVVALICLRTSLRPGSKRYFNGSQTTKKGDRNIPSVTPRSAFAFLAASFFSCAFV